MFGRSPTSAASPIHERSITRGVRFVGGRLVSHTALAFRRASLFTASLLFALASAASGQVQPGRITGIVKDSTAGFPIGGVGIVIMGTTFGASTTDDGRYTVT